MVDNKQVAPINLCGLRTGIKHSHLEAALSLQLHGSFVKAAEALGAKSPAISRNIRDLEFLLGTKIFDRQGNGQLRPTPAGVIFLRETRAHLTTFRRLIESMRQVGDGKTGSISVGYYGTLAHGALHDLLLKPDPLFQAIRLRPVELPHDVISIGLATGYVDVAVVWGLADKPAGDVLTRPAWNERILAILPEHHPLAGAASLIWSDLADELFLISSRDPVKTISQFLTENLAPLHRKPRIVVHDVGPTTIIHMIAAGHGIGLNLETMLGVPLSGTVYREISGETGPEYVTAFTCWREDNSNPILERFLKRMMIRFPTPTEDIR